MIDAAEGVPLANSTPAKALEVGEESRIEHHIWETFVISIRLGQHCCPVFPSSLLTRHGDAHNRSEVDRNVANIPKALAFWRQHAGRDSLRGNVLDVGTLG